MQLIIKQIHCLGILILEAALEGHPSIEGSVQTYISCTQPDLSFMQQSVRGDHPAIFSQSPFGITQKKESSNISAQNSNKNM